MTQPAFASALVVGAGEGGIDLALELARAGLETRLLESDPHSFARLTDVLRGAAPKLRIVSAPPHSRVDLLIHAQMDGPEPAPLRAGLTLSCRADAPSIGFFPIAPLYLRRVVELTDERAIPVARLLGLLPMLVQPGQPRPGQRIARRLEDVADAMLFHGAIPHELDEAMVAFGFDIGFYEAQDLIGLDVAYAARRAARQLDPDLRFPPFADRMVQEGRLGKQAGVGWYRYPGGGGAVIDPLVEDLIREEAWFANIPQRSFDQEEMQMQMALAFVQEGRALVQMGILPDAAAYDRLCCAAFGFPVALGGPLAWCQQDPRAQDWLASFPQG